MAEMSCALFPLNTVLFPDGPLPLRIFETRYLDMVSDCLRNDKPFGVCLIRNGQEAGAPAETFETGTLARIVDWNQLEGGLLGITARGERRFRLTSRRVQADKLVVGQVVALPEEQPVALPNEHRSLADLLREFVEHLSEHYSHVNPDYEDATWVGYRLAEILPIPMSRKQYFLELEDPLVRLSQVAEIVAEISQSDHEHN